MAAPDEPCLACELVAGRVTPVGGTLLVAPGLHLHGVLGPTPVPGWVVVTAARHVRCLADLDDAEAVALARLAVRVQRAQRDVLGAETSYAVSLGEQVRHLHLHLVPRYADTPERLRGPRIFQASPADAIPADAQARAVDALAVALRTA